LLEEKLTCLQTQACYETNRGALVFGFISTIPTDNDQIPLNFIRNKTPYACRQLNKLVVLVLSTYKKAEPIMGSTWYYMGGKLVTVRSEH